jgi:hypothetical protein
MLICDGLIFTWRSAIRSDDNCCFEATMKDELAALFAPGLFMQNLAIRLKQLIPIGKYSSFY